MLARYDYAKTDLSEAKTRERENYEKETEKLDYFYHAGSDDGGDIHATCRHHRN